MQRRRVKTSLGELNSSVFPLGRFLITLMQSSTIQFQTQAEQNTHSSLTIPISPAFQKRALVGQASIHNLHSTPLQVFMLIVTSPSSKYSLTPIDWRSCSRAVCFSFFFLSEASRRSLWISTVEALFCSLDSLLAPLSFLLRIMA